MRRVPIALGGGATRQSGARGAIHQRAERILTRRGVSRNSALVARVGREFQDARVRFDSPIGIPMPAEYVAV